MSRHILKYIVIIFCIAAPCSHIAAQPSSYIYIQGDKEMPFYVKVEDKMMPRYGKNYCIIPNLYPGPVNIEILFQQNALPSEHFTINVPANGYRGFLLNKLNGSYALYDLQKKKYLDTKEEQ